MLRKIRGIINSLFYKTQRLRNGKSISVPHDFKAKTEFTLSLFLFFAYCICLFELKDKNIVFDSEVTNFFDDDNPQNVSDYKSMIEDVIKCLKKSNSPHGYANITKVPPFFERKKHYYNLLKKTQKYRYNDFVNTWVGYQGPWIEDIWVDYFIGKKYSEFGPFVPLFVDWLNMFLITKRKMKKYHKLTKEIFDLLKPDYLYITVTGGDQAIEGVFNTDKYPLEFPKNLLVLSASGRGHIAILQNAKLYNVVEPLPEKNFLTFLGSFHFGRKSIIKKIQKYYKGTTKFFYGKRKDWIKTFRESRFILSLVGNARGCYRTDEILELGLVPVLYFKDIEWVPYYGSKNLDWSKVGIVGTNLDDILHKLDKIDDKELNEMRKYIRDHHDTHFSINGTIRQISLFLKYGFEKSSLTCSRYSKTYR